MYLSNTKQKLLIAFFIIILALVIEMRFLEPAGFPLPLSLAAILGLTSLMDGMSILFLSLFSFFMLNWRPGFTPEFAAFLVVPLMASFLQSFLPLKSGFNAAGIGVMGIVLWYIVINPSGTFASPLLIIFEAVLCGFVAAFVFGFFGWASDSLHPRRV